jgi:WD40 repeat protein
MDTKSVIARFEAERQALAMMDHPNIAKVLDAGATETGRPYFVMELVTGVSITEYCDKNNLSTKERLSLFIEVCNAVQHAHQKGIIHRDIKPANVMVTQHEGKPVPKVIDFGIAKATNQRLTERTLFTRYAHIIGTPAYMSPEQAELSELDIDTRTDVYSLGVLLYELITEMTPFSEEELRKAGYIEMQRIIREEVPTIPSTKLSTLGKTLTDVAKHRSSTPEILRKTIQGDLDWIVMKSLEKDRARRYETASELAMDIERHLDDEPVLAGPPSAGYRLCKFVRRNRVAVITGLLVVVGLIIVAILSTMNAVETEKARQETSALLAGSYVDRAQTLCEQGEVGRGMLWLVESLKTAPAGSSDLDRAVRTSLAAWQTQLPSLRAVVQYPDWIRAIAFSPDGTRFLAACRDGTARLGDGATGRQIGSPLNHGSVVTDVAFSPDGNRFATHGLDGSLRLWDAATLKPVGEPMQHARSDTVGQHSILFSPGSSRLMTAGADGAVRIWDADTGRSLGKAFQYEGEGWAHALVAAYCPGGLRVVLALGRGDSRLGTYQMFDADRGTPIGPSVKVGRPLAGVAISPDGKRFAVAKGDSLIYVWEAATGELVCDPIVHGGWNFALAFSPDGKRIISGGTAHVAIVWDLATGGPIGTPLRQRITLDAVAFSPDGKRVITANRHGVLRIWDLIQVKYAGEPVTHEDRILAAAYYPDGLRIVTETDGMAQVREASTGKVIGKPISYPDGIDLFDLSPDGLRLMTIQLYRRNAWLWDVVTGELVGTLSIEPPSWWISRVAFSPDSSRILAGDNKGHVRLWDAATLECLAEFHEHQRPIGRVVFSPDGSRFFAASAGGNTQQWDAATLEPIGDLLACQGAIRDLAISPDCAKVLMGLIDGTIWLRDGATLEPIGAPLQQTEIVNSVAFSPDSSQFVTCFMQGKARIWDAATLKPIGPPLEHDGWWPDVSFNPDDSEILIADDQGTVAVWQAPPGPIQGTYERITCWVEVVTGLELDATGEIKILDAATWQERCQKLQELGGPPG